MSCRAVTWERHTSGWWVLNLRLRYGHIDAHVGIAKSRPVHPQVGVKQNDRPSVSLGENMNSKNLD